MPTETVACLPPERNEKDFSLLPRVASLLVPKKDGHVLTLLESLRKTPSRTAGCQQCANLKIGGGKFMLRLAACNPLQHLMLFSNKTVPVCSLNAENVTRFVASYLLLIKLSCKTSHKYKLLLVLLRNLHHWKLPALILLLCLWPVFHFVKTRMPRKLEWRPANSAAFIKSKPTRDWNSH